jgi:hypothetical protein
LNDYEKRMLQYALEDIRPAFDELVKYCIDPLRNSSPAIATRGFSALWELLSATLTIGFHGEFRESAKEFFRAAIEREAAETRAARMRAANGAKTGPRIASLDAAIKAEAEARQISITVELGFAKTVRDGVIDRLVRDEVIQPLDRATGSRRYANGWPSIATIKIGAARLMHKRTAMRSTRPRLE